MDRADPEIGGAAMTPTVALLIAMALAFPGTPSGRRRLRSLAAPAPAVPAPEVVLRPQWIAVGVIAAGALIAALAGPVAGVVAGAAAGAAGATVLRRASSAAHDDGAGLAGRWELLAVCLEAGLPIASAVSAAADPLDGPAGSALRRVAGLLELGADPAEAWSAATGQPALAAFARAAGRSAATGAALADVARGEASRIRAELIDTAQARAERAAVLITGPLGLCFLPAFLVLGIAPVVIGLAGDALARW
jgi:pilus assembly protein TadC